MKQLLTLLIILISSNSISQNLFKSSNSISQNLFKNIYKDFLKYGTIYIAGDIDNPKEEPKDYFVRTNPDGNLYTPPVVVDGTDYYDYDYRYGFGIRKITRLKVNNTMMEQKVM